MVYILTLSPYTVLFDKTNNFSQNTSFYNVEITHFFQSEIHNVPRHAFSNSLQYNLFIISNIFLCVNSLPIASSFIINWVNSNQKSDPKRYYKYPLCSGSKTKVTDKKDDSHCRLCVKIFFVRFYRHIFFKSPQFRVYRILAHLNPPHQKIVNIIKSHVWYAHCFALRNATPFTKVQNPTLGHYWSK